MPWSIKDFSMPKYLVFRTVSYYMSVEALRPSKALEHAETKMSNTPEADGWIWSGDDLDIEPEPCDETIEPQ